MASRIPSRIGSNRTAVSAVDPNGLWKISKTTEGAVRTWLVLTSDAAMPAFPAGTPVLITEVLPLLSSPTVSEDQNAVGLGPTNAQYWFKKLNVRTERVDIQSGATTGCPVMQGMLSLQKPPERGPQPPPPDRILKDNERVYVAKPVPAARTDQYGGSFEVPIGTRVKIRSRNSRDGPDRLLASNDRHKTAARYILTVALEVERSDWERCHFPVNHYCFRLPRADEMALIRKLESETPPPRVVSYGDFD